MFGGVAQRYILWKMEGEPYKKNGAWYVKVLHPATHLSVEVRWYTDKAHADLMPKPKGEENFPGKMFGFENKNDYVLAFRQRDLTKAEEENHFHFNWQRGGQWRFGMFFGGIWYAPKTAKVPHVTREDKCFRVTWPDFVKAARVHTTELTGKKEGWWYDMEV